jgi:hypothetical protein
MLLALLLAAAQPTAPVTAPAPATAVRPDAMELIGVLNPEGPMVDMVVRTFTDSMRSVVETNEDYQQLDQDYPGISRAIVDAMAQAMRADLIADLPVNRRRYARFYEERFTPGEIAELIRFYSSSAGQRLIAAKFAKLDAKPLMEEFAENPESQVSQQHIRDMNRAATSSIIGEMSAGDRNALLVFARTPVFVKVTAARGPMEELETQIANEPDPALDKALEEAANSVIQRFTGKKSGAE